MNDACLFEKAGVAVAMAKAPPELVKISTYQIGENRQLQSLAAVLRARID
jgi:hydroxymethylpyrimidine pyrophosphatase-like HAD family hydrolase